ncbi:hypothetical protein HW561_15535 [Rhodobacteraceae bacterium B1Z28]|uniref:Uncharacterized protein n=1 Tax=Ruegeria haliotis TaxID=2747601 RepID=A0ABX2PSR8_9RHOB|nr:hypothetical protein [Ruegeria haliotis]NVO57205.1 hypothetical protein [Ruegeria haliotis]
MKKIYKLKQWYSIEDAASRLSLTLGEDVNSAEILELALDGHICLHWFMRYVSAQEVEFQIRSIWVSPDEDKELFGLAVEGKDAVEIKFSNFFPLESRTSVSVLDGPHRLRLDLCGALEDYLRARLTNTGGELTSLDGFFVEDDNGRVFQVLEAFGGSYLKNMYPEERVKFHDVRGYFPSVDWPAFTELGFTKQEIESFESTLQNNEEKVVASRERHTLYKMLIAMAVDGYGFDSSALKSPFPKDLEGILDRLGLPVSDDTIRQKLKEASELLDQNAGK